MIFGFLLIIYFGQIPLMFLIIFLQAAMFREIVRLGSTASRERKLKGYFTWLQWYWFCVALFFTYGSFLKNTFGFSIPRHTFISFSLYAAGLIAFVLLLKQGQLKYQFGMFAWCHLTLLLVVVQSSFLVVSMYQGLIWAVLPAMCIISNDMWAYQIGIFGHRRLIAISPKKTWEGFIGGGVCTLFFAFIVSFYLSRFQLFVCPQPEFTFNHPECTPSATFQPQDYDVPAFVHSLFALVGVDMQAVSVLPMQWHALSFAMFASLVAPFGGFFASGFKRAFKFKDFGDVIPGHGGFTDRMDCQIIMGLFAYVYYWNFVRASFAAEDVFKSYNFLEFNEKLSFLRLVMNTTDFSALSSSL